MQETFGQTSCLRRLGRRAIAAGLAACSIAIGSAASAQEFRLRQEARLQQRANGILAIMGYSVVPDLTSSNLSINNAQAENPSVLMTQLGGADTFSR